MLILLLLLTLLPGAVSNYTQPHRYHCVVLFVFAAPLEKEATPTAMTVWRPDVSFYPQVAATEPMTAAPLHLLGPVGLPPPSLNSSVPMKPIEQSRIAPPLNKTVNNSPVSERLVVAQLLAIHTSKPLASINRTELEMIRTQNRQGLEIMFSAECLFRLAILLLSLIIFFFEILKVEDDDEQENDPSVVSRSVQTDGGYVADDEMTTASALSEEDVFQVLDEVLAELDNDFLRVLVQEQAMQNNRLNTISERTEPSDADPNSDSDC